MTTNRITDRNLDYLDYLVDRINAATGSIAKPYIDGKAQIGNYHLSGAYGGVSLHRMHNESGGISDVFQCGHVPKRDLYNRMRAYLVGIEAKAEAVQS